MTVLYPNPLLLRVEAFIGLLSDEQLDNLVRVAKNGHLVTDTWGEWSPTDYTACLTVAPLPITILETVFDVIGNDEREDSIESFIASHLDGSITEQDVNIAWMAWDRLKDEELEHVLNWLTN